MDMPYERGMIHREIGTRLRDQAYLDSSMCIFRQIGNEKDHTSKNAAEYVRA
jgi:hypothetical protein